MPNWSSCKLLVKGSREDIAAFVEKLPIMDTIDDEKSKVFSLASFLPIPDILLCVSSPENEICVENATGNFVSFNDVLLAQEAKGLLFKEAYEATRKLVSMRKLTPEEQRKLLDEHGSTNWYEWTITNWGVKWDAKNHRKSHIRDESAEFWFKTPWAPPTVGVARISEAWPGLEFELSFAEMGMGFYGTELIAQGDVETLEMQNNVSFYQEREDEDEDEDEDEEYILTEEVAAFLSTHQICVGG